MRGYSHALTGAGAWGALTTASVAGLGVADPAPVRDMTGMVLVAGFALLPDADHHGGSIARSLPSLGPIPSPSRLACEGIARLSGGHRHGTHSLLGVAAFALLAWLATFVTVTGPDGRTIHLGAGLVAGVGIAFAVKALHWSSAVGNQVRGRGLMATVVRVLLRSWLGPWLAAVLGAGIVTCDGYDWPLLVPMVAVGCIVHSLGDMLTVGGVPWLWPWHPRPPEGLRRLVSRAWYRNGYFAFPLLGRTTSTREVVFAVLIALYVVWMFVHALSSAAGHRLW